MTTVHHNKQIFGNREYRNSLEDAIEAATKHGTTPVILKSDLIAVAEVQTGQDVLDDAYALTQNGEWDWHQFPEVKSLTTPPNNRSTSIGDVIETNDGEFFVVAPMGFEKCIVIDKEKPE